MKHKKENLNNRASIALLTPFAKMNSSTRLDMASQAFKHCIILDEGESPYIDSVYTNDILLSTDNIIEKGKVEHLRTINKVINGEITERTILYAVDGLVKFVTLPKYGINYKFGYKQTSELLDMDIEKPVDGNTWVKYYEAYDKDSGEIKFGKNIRSIYTISRKTGEDAFVITDKLAREMRRTHIDVIERIITKDMIGRNIHGGKTESGEIVYKPIPLPGDKVNGKVMSFYNSDDTFLTYDDKIPLNSDKDAVIAYEGVVTDIDVFSMSPCKLECLEKIRQECKEYASNISRAIQHYHADSRYRVSDSTNILLERMSLIAGSDGTASILYGSEIELKDSALLRITIASEHELEVGDKLTNRYGGKGTITNIVKAGSMVTEDGEEIDMLINATSVFGRINMGQLYEIGLSGLWLFVQKYLIKSKDDDKTKKDNILKWLNYANQFKSVELLKESSAHDLVEYYKKNHIVMKYKPYDDPDDEERMNLEIFTKLVEFTNTLEPVVNTKVYIDGKPLSMNHYHGYMFYLLLANGPFKDTSIRGQDGISPKGSPLKAAKNKKIHETKFGTTAVKQSDLALNIFVNPLYEEDKDLLSNTTLSFHDLLNSIGIEAILSNGESDED